MSQRRQHDYDSPPEMGRAVGPAVASGERFHPARWAGLTKLSAPSGLRTNVALAFRTHSMGAINLVTRLHRDHHFHNANGPIAG